MDFRANGTLKSGGDPFKCDLGVQIFVGPLIWFSGTWIFNISDVNRYNALLQTERIFVR